MRKDSKIDIILNLLFIHGPHESPETLLFGGFIQFTERFQEWGHFFVFHDCQHRGVHPRPGMAAVMGFTVVAAPAGDAVPTGKSMYPVTIQEKIHLLGVRLVIGNKYCFHFSFI
jgi:hypothetical protein